MNPLDAVRVPVTPGEPVVDPACWTPDELTARDDWTFQLSGQEIADLEAMAEGVRMRIGGESDGLMALGSDDFDLGAFAETVDAARRVIADGLGIALIRGFPVERWDRLTSAIVYWGFGRRLGTALPNNPEGEMFGHIADMGKDYDNPKHRGYQTSAEMLYHADHGDILSLLSLTKAKSGGKTKVTSSLALHNAMLARRPDYLDALTQSYTYSQHGEEQPGQDPWFESPPFCYVDGRLSVSAGYKHIEKGHKLPGRAPLTETQLAAFAFLEDLAEELHVGVTFEPGDLVVLNSHVTLHARTAFEDWPEPERRRHLWRLWLRADGFHPRSPFFEARKVGVPVPEDQRKVTLEAWPEVVR